MNPIAAYNKSNFQTSELAGVRSGIAPERLSRAASVDYTSPPGAIKRNGEDAVKVNFSSAARSYSELSEKSAPQVPAKILGFKSEKESGAGISAVA